MVWYSFGVVDNNPGTTLTKTVGHEKRPGGKATRPYLVLAFECDRPLADAGRYSLGEVESATLGRGSVRGVVRTAETGVRSLTVRVEDPWMSSTHATLSRVLGRWVLEDSGSRNGTLVNGVAQKRAVLADGDVLELGHTFFVFREAMPYLPDDKEDVASVDVAAPAPGLVTLLKPLARELGLLPQVSRSPVSVLVRGESGTGKEVIARAIHRLSTRSGPFIAVNCGALPDNLVESELFGFRKGAFSGATEDRPGLVRSAEGGTLFLDEIGDLPAASQAAFLRVLQEREVMPIGANRPVPVDFRLVAATHRDLEALVEKESFRGDSLARITGFQVKLPPLRQRREDLGVLIASLLRRLDPGRAGAIKFSVDAARAIFRHEWPSNIRELEKALAAGMVLAADGRIELDHLPAGVGAEQKQTTAPNTPSPTLEPPPLSVDDLRRKEQLHALMTEHAGNISAVARVMGKARMQIQRWIKRYGLDPESYKR